MVGRDKIVRLGIAALAISFAAGCGGSGGSHPTHTAAASASAVAVPAPGDTAGGTAFITINGSGFGKPQTVNPGEPVRLANKGTAPVTVSSGSAFSVQVPAGGSADFTAPTVPGAYPLTGGTLHGTLYVRGV